MRSEEEIKQKLEDLKYDIMIGGKMLNWATKKGARIALEWVLT